MPSPQRAAAAPQCRGARSSAAVDGRRRALERCSSAEPEVRERWRARGPTLSTCARHAHDTAHARSRLPGHCFLRWRSLTWRCFACSSSTQRGTSGTKAARKSLTRTRTCSRTKTVQTSDNETARCRAWHTKQCSSSYSVCISAATFFSHSAVSSGTETVMFVGRYCHAGYSGVPPMLR